MAVEIVVITTVGVITTTIVIIRTIYPSDSIFFYEIPKKK
jgi:hypothetical protein